MTSSKERWASLVRSFPTVKRHAESWDLRTADEVLAALGVRYSGKTDAWEVGDRAPWLTAGSLYALLFCLDVWNSGLRELLPSDLRDWSIITAWSRWDPAHRAIVQVFLADPFYP